MILNEYSSKKLTANQKAKEIVMSYLNSSFYWMEKDPDLYEKMTDKEKDEVQRMLQKKYSAIRKYLNLKN